jgi:DnaK suppressor protein
MTSAAVGIADASFERRDDIRRVLVKRRRELLNEIHRRVRDVREVGTNVYRHVTDLGDAVESEPEEAVVFALIEMKAETLERVNEAVRHVDDGTYGYCIDCAGRIASSRLRAMPFAVRCRDCEESRENEQHRNAADEECWGYTKVSSTPSSDRSHHAHLL